MKKITYREARKATLTYKVRYLHELEQLIELKEAEAYEERRIYCRDIFKDPEKYRSQFQNMLGWPLNHPIEGCLPSAESTLLAREEGFDILRVHLEVLPGLNITGLLFRQGRERKPLVICQHGGQGTPEIMAEFYGTTDNYNHIIQRLLSRNVHVFAPQLLLWADTYGVKNNRKELDAKLKRVDSSIAAVEI